jgi:hypothetical protein
MTGFARRASMEAVANARDDYLRRLDDALVGPRRVKRDLLREAADHLEDAAYAYRDAGYDEPDAASMAVADFGAVDEVAPAFQTTLAVASSRRTAWMLFAFLAIQPFLWDGGLSLADARSAPEGVVYAVLDIAVEVVGAVMLLSAVLLVAATGIGNRWLRAGRTLARLTGLVTIGAALWITLTGISMTLLSSGLEPVHWAMLGVFIVAPMSLTAASARRTLAAA